VSGETPLCGFSLDFLGFVRDLPSKTARMLLLRACGFKGRLDFPTRTDRQKKAGTEQVNISRKEGRLVAKEIRGIQAVEYARTRGLGFLIDEPFLTRAETTIQHRPASIDDIDILLEQQTGEEYDPTKVQEGTSTYDFFLNRYGDGWIYVPLESNHPLEDERAVLSLFHNLLTTDNPRSGGDILEIASGNPPQLQDTGFPAVADAALLFHAALRLVDKRLLEAVPDPKPLPKNAFRNYGNTYFILPTELSISLPGLLCERCLGHRISTSLKLHHMCARKLNDALSNALQPARTGPSLAGSPNAP